MTPLPHAWTPPRQIVSKWRKHFFEQRLAGLEEQPRGGRPAQFPPPSVVVAVKALACELPHIEGVPLSRWCLAEIKREVIGRWMRASRNTASASISSRRTSTADR
ncbi:MAG TPA: helix-turn-helix domain-containing protein [Gammaproteobacteria bacterium]